MTHLAAATLDRSAPARVLVAPRRHVAPSVTLRAIARAVRLGLQPLRAQPPQRLADWAAAHFVLTADSSHKTGAWEAWPFQIGWMDAFSNDDIEQVDVQKSKRVGYTKTVVAYVGWCVAHRHRKVALWQPTDDDRDSFVKSEIDPMVAEVPAVRAARRATKDGDTIKYKAFRGAVAHFLGGKAARSYRRITVAAVVLDEADGFDQQIERSSDPVTLARGRLEGAPFPKFIIGSTPRLKGYSHVERQVEIADARLRYHIPCMHCGVEHPLTWGGKTVAHGFKWDGHDHASVANVRHVCPHCRESITQADYLRIWGQGAWVCDITGVRYGADRTWRSAAGEPIRAPRHVAFHEVWAAYSPQREWVDIVREFLAAHTAFKAGDNGPLQGFTNETLARTWEEEYEHTEAELLRRRARAEALPLGVVPAGACLVNAAIDVQADRWEYTAWAVGRGRERWAIDHRVIYGNTADLTQWRAQLDGLVGTSYPHAHGGRLAVGKIAVDTGFQTHTAYEWARLHQHRGVHAVKGDNQPGKPIKARMSRQDINARGRTIRRGVQLWHVGTDSAKDLLHGCLQLEGAGPGHVHFAAGLPDTWFDGLTAEQRVPVRTVRGVEHRWECPSGRRNEPLDTAVYCLFLEELLGLSTWTDRQWQRAESALMPDLFDGLATEPEQPDNNDPTAAAPAPAAAPATDPTTRAETTRKPTPRPAPAGIASDEWSSRL